MKLTIIFVLLFAGCKFKFTSQYKLSDHMRTHTKERVIACPTCGKMFATKTKFYDHRKRQLPVECMSEVLLSENFIVLVLMMFHFSTKLSMFSMLQVVS